MSNQHPFQQGEIYRIIVAGILNDTWSDWFDGFTITHQGEDETILEGPVSDQSALHGLLAKIRNLGLRLNSVECLPPKTNHAET